MRKSVAAIALIALLASGAHAKPEGAGNGGQGRGKDQAQGGSSGRGGPSSDQDRHGGGKRKGGGESMAQGSSDRGPKAQSGKGPDRGAGNAPRQEFERGHGSAHGDDSAWADRGKARKDRHDWDDGDHDRGRFDRGRDDRHNYRVASRGLVDGCPPGLAKKFNGCMPPGQAKKRERYAYNRSDWWGFSSRSGGNYYYRDGFLLRLGSGGRISGYIPLLGGALRLGTPWPEYYEPRPLPRYFVRYYDLGRQDSYRYADNVIYRMDPKTTAIMSVAALLTGDKFRVGQPMPSGYGVYNVPYSYRDRYYDRPDAHYRYADGQIYEINPKTMLIASVISLAI